VGGGSAAASLAIAEAAGLLVIRHDTPGQAAAHGHLAARRRGCRDAQRARGSRDSPPWPASPHCSADRTKFVGGPASTTGSRPDTRPCCSGRNSSCASCGCSSATTPCSSAVPISWLWAAATPRLLVMEEADLCIRLHRLGRTSLVNRVVITSDRRVAAWGALGANWIYLEVGARWGLGLRKGLERYSPDVR